MGGSIPTWMGYALLAALLWAIVNVLDKRILERRDVNLNARLFLDMIVSCIAAILCFAFVDVQYHLGGIVIGLLAGVLVFLFNINYYKSLQRSSVTVVAIFLQLIPIFSFTIGWILFGERFSFPVYAGILLIILGAGFVIVENLAGGNAIRTARNNLAILFCFIVPGALFMSINYGIIEYLLESYNVVTVYFLGRVGLTLGSMFYFASKAGIFSDLDWDIFAGKKRTFSWVALIEVFNILAIYLLVVSYSSGPITLVATTASTQPLFVIAITVMLSVFVSRGKSRDSRSKVGIFVVRMLAATTQVAGVYLLSVA